MSVFDNTVDAKRLSTTSERKQWKCIAITLDPEGKRYKTFLENNNHIQIETFKGVKGADLSKEKIISQGLATEELITSGLTNDGRIGCAASHRAVWHKAAKEGKGYLVLEDDCHVHPRVSDFIEDNLTKLMHIDICRFGINTDSILQSISPKGLASLSLFDPKHPSEEWIRNALSKTSAEEVELHRLIKAFGNCAYFISPSGAKRLSEKIFPLSTRTTQIPLIANKMPASGLDRAANGIYSQLQAYVCQPFLAYTPNTDSTTNK